MIPFRKATECHIHVSGAEFNVAANLSDCFRLKTGIVSAMVDYPIGDLIAEGVRAKGVTPFYKLFAHDGVTGPNMATVYSDHGYGVRGPVVFYNRANEAAAALKPGDFDWSEIFTGGVRWFHSGGIFAALSATTSELIIEGMKAAKAAGAVVSFDLNYRQKLWNLWGGHDQAVPVFRRIVENVDVLVGNEEDLQMALGIPGPEVGRCVRAGLEHLRGDDRGSSRQLSADQGGRDHASGRGLEQPAPLGGGCLDRRRGLFGTDLRARRARPRRRWRRVRFGSLLRPSDG